MIITGEFVNNRIRAEGIVALVDLSGDRVWFYPRGKLSVPLMEYLAADNSAKVRLLRNYLVNLVRGPAAGV